MINIILNVCSKQERISVYNKQAYKNTSAAVWYLILLSTEALCKEGLLEENGSKLLDNITAEW